MVCNIHHKTPIYVVDLQGCRYKCYAAHIAQLYASKDAQKHLRTLGHFFKTTDTLENLLGLAAANYELSKKTNNQPLFLSHVLATWRSDRLS